jgi:hypothetical protein
MKITKLVLKTLIVLLVSTACSALPNQKSIQSTPTPQIRFYNSTDQIISVEVELISNKTRKIPEAMIYLSKNASEGQEGIPAILAFSYQSSPLGILTETGSFVFLNVAPGQYALTLWSPMAPPYFMKSADGNDYLWVNVEADKSLNLGKIEVP